MWWKASTISRISKLVRRVDPTILTSRRKLNGYSLKGLRSNFHVLDMNLGVLTCRSPGSAPFEDIVLFRWPVHRINAHIPIFGTLEPSTGSLSTRRQTPHLCLEKLANPDLCRSCNPAAYLLSDPSSFWRGSGKPGRRFHVIGCDLERKTSRAYSDSRNE